MADNTAEKQPHTQPKTDDQGEVESEIQQGGNWNVENTTPEKLRRLNRRRRFKGSQNGR